MTPILTAMFLVAACAGAWFGRSRLAILYLITIALHSVVTFSGVKRIHTKSHRCAMQCLQIRYFLKT